MSYQAIPNDDNNNSPGSGGMGPGDGRDWSGYNATPTVSRDDFPPTMGGSINNNQDEGVPGEDLPLIGSYAGIQHIKQDSFRSFRDFTTNKDLRNSVYIMLTTIFLQSMGFSIVLPSLWFYLSKQPAWLTDQEFGGPPPVTFLGYVVAIYSFGQLVGSPLFGWWSNRSPSKTVVIITLFLSCFGNALYAMARDVFPVKPFIVNEPFWRWVVFFARFLVGISAGNVAVCRAYCSHASDVNNRSKIMAYMSAAQGIGFGLGPAFSAALAKIDFHIGTLYIDGSTSVGWLSALFSLINGLALIWIRFQELPHATADVTQPTTRAEWMSIINVLVLFFITIGVFSIFETMASVVLYHFYDWTELYIGLLFVGASFIGVIAYVSVSLPQAKRFDERNLLIFGTVLTILSLLVLPSWSFAGEAIPPLGQFLVGTLLLSYAYPISTVEIVILYSKVLHPKGQGTKMGLLTAAGSASRMLCPIWASNIWTIAGKRINITDPKMMECLQCNTNPETDSNAGSSGSESLSECPGEVTNFCDSSVALFFSTAGAVVIALILTLVIYRKLVPHPAYSIKSHTSSSSEAPAKH